MPVSVWLSLISRSTQRHYSVINTDRSAHPGNQAHLKIKVRLKIKLFVCLLRLLAIAGNGAVQGCVAIFNLTFRNLLQLINLQDNNILQLQRQTK